MKLSIIVPAYNEAKSLPKLVALISSELSRTNYEIVIVDDGSSDNTKAVLKNLKKKNTHLRAISLRQNSGKSPAIATGFKYSKGDIVVTIDADLQDDPGDIKKLLKKMDQGWDVVSGSRVRRADTGTKQLSTKLFNWFVSNFSGLKLSDYNCGLKAYRKEALAETKIKVGMHRFLTVIAYWQGFSVTEVKVKNLPRKFGKTKYGPWRAISGILDFLTIYFIYKYSRRPVRLFGVMGAFLSSVGFLIGIYLTFLRFSGEKIGDRPLLSLAILLMVLGVQFISIGLLGEMISHSQDEIYNAEEL